MYHLDAGRNGDRDPLLAKRYFYNVDSRSSAKRTPLFDNGTTSKSANKTQTVSFGNKNVAAMKGNHIILPPKGMKAALESSEFLR